MCRSNKKNNAMWDGFVDPPYVMLVGYAYMWYLGMLAGCMYMMVHPSMDRQRMLC
jgi:hypothetical protein